MTLSKLCVAAAGLPDVEPDSTDPRRIEREEVAEIEARFTELQHLLGALDRYELEGGDERSIAFDLVEVYFDLVRDLDYMRSGAPPSDVISQWRSSFTFHWGDHAEGALQGIRALVGPASS